MENSKAIFVTNQFGGKKLFDEKGLIGAFKDSVSNIVAGDDGVKRRVGNSIWVMVLTDPKKIERARNYPGFGITFNEADKEPVYNTVNNLKTLRDPNSGIPGQIAANQNVNIELQAEKQRNAELANDMRRYGILFSQICKAGGEYLKDADPALIAEFETIKNKHGISEKDFAKAV